MMNPSISFGQFLSAWRADLAAESGLAWLLAGIVMMAVVLGVLALVDFVLTRRRERRDREAQEAMARGWLVRRMERAREMGAGRLRAADHGLN